VLEAGCFIFLSFHRMKDYNFLVVVYMHVLFFLFPLFISEQGDVTGGEVL